MNLILHGDCIDEMRDLPDNCVSLIVTDPPYFKVKAEAWDNQWAGKTEYLQWLSLCVEQWFRLLKPNGSLYCFAWPTMVSSVEALLEKHFNVLNRIVWVKGDGAENKGGLWNRANKSTLRRFFTQKEELLFCEHYGADSYAKGVCGYRKKCDTARGFIFEPLRSYLAKERDRVGLTTRDVAVAFQQKTGSRAVTGMAGHWFDLIQWELPTRANYEWLRGISNMNSITTVYFKREYEELRAEYEGLRAEYEGLRRPFNATPSVQYTDVWSFSTVSPYPKKHPCEKPVDLLQHMITMSSNRGDTVLDCFMGTGSTCIACLAVDRYFIGIEQNATYYKIARERIRDAFSARALTMNQK